MRARDPNEVATLIVDLATGEIAEESAADQPQKNPAAVALGKLGGRKGGEARAKALSAQERADIARKAAQVRWSRNNAK
jgi:hypothetical protein